MTHRRRQTVKAVTSLILAVVLALLALFLSPRYGYPPGGYPSLEGLAPGSAEALERQKAAAREYGLPVEIRNSIGMRFRLIPPGTFVMGSPPDEPGRGDDEIQHRVTLTKVYYLAATEVTQGQWKAVMGVNPGDFQGASDVAPVQMVSWDDCQKFIRRLCEKENVPVGTYRLPSEAEWEYACRAGTSTAFYSGDCTQPDAIDPNLDRIGWYDENSLTGFAPKGVMKATIDWIEKQIKHDIFDGPQRKPRPVGRKAANAWGLYDMSGNVSELCGDRYGAYTGAAVDPSGPGSGSDRVYRGAGWSGLARHCRSAFRSFIPPNGFGGDLGLRLLRTCTQ